MILDIILFFTYFSILDLVLEKMNIQGRYYLNHFIANSIIVYNTFSDMIYCYTDFYTIHTYPINYYSMSIVFSLHFYHMVMYLEKLRIDDWLHHIILVVFSLPLSLSIDVGALLGHAIFFTTGLPGGIDYLLLFLARNNIIKKITEKRINKQLNLWIRCPGCISNSTMILIYSFTAVKIGLMYYINFLGALFISASLYWNGVYFMEQVVSNYAVAYSNKK